MTAAAWRISVHPGQAEFIKRWSLSMARIFVACVSRRWGKSRTALAICIQFALGMPGVLIRYAAPTAKMVATIVVPLLRELVRHAPPDSKPRYHKQEGVFRFQNGSEIWIAGCDNGNAERHRGTAMHLGVVDECGFIDDLEYLIKDILLPQTIATGGRILLISTPPRSPDHPFRKRCERAEQRGAYFHATIHDAAHISAKDIAEYIEESGGADSTTWKREYLAQFVVDETIAVVPEFARVEKDIVEERPIPAYRDCYVALDVGFTDLSVALFGYLDFDGAVLVVEDEAVFARKTSAVISEGCKAKELELWQGVRGSARSQPLERVADAPEIVLADMSRDHKYDVRPPVKDDRDAAVTAMRTAIANKRIRINPRCKTLIAHLRHAIWNKRRSSFERSADDGHFDALDALIYLVRTVQWNRNPYPLVDPAAQHATHFIPPHIAVNKQSQKILQAFRPRFA